MGSLSSPMCSHPPFSQSFPFLMEGVLANGGVEEGGVDGWLVGWLVAWLGGWLAWLGGWLARGGGQSKQSNVLTSTLESFLAFSCGREWSGGNSEGGGGPDWTGLD